MHCGTETGNTLLEKQITSYLFLSHAWLSMEYLCLLHIQGRYTLFFIRTSKFCRASLFLIFGDFSLNLFLICSYFCERVKMMRNQKKKTKTRHWKSILIVRNLKRYLHLSKITDLCAFCPLSPSSPTGCRGHLLLYTLRT